MKAFYLLSVLVCISLVGCASTPTYTGVTQQQLNEQIINVAEHPNCSIPPEVVWFHLKEMEIQAGPRAVAPALIIWAGYQRICLHQSP